MEQNIQYNHAMNALEFGTFMPDFLSFDERYADLPLGAKVLWSYLLKKMKYTGQSEGMIMGVKTNNYTYYDEDGNKWILADRTELSMFIGAKSKKTVTTYTKLLEEKGLLRSKQGYQKALAYGVLIPAHEVKNGLGDFFQMVQAKRKEEKETSKIETPTSESKTEEKEPRALEPQKKGKIYPSKKGKIYTSKKGKIYPLLFKINKYIKIKRYLKIKDIKKKNLKDLKPQQQKDIYIPQGEKERKKEILKMSQVPELVADKVIDRLAEKGILGQATNQNIMIGAIKSMEALKHSSVDVPHLFIAKYIENEVGVSALPVAREVEVLEVNEGSYNPTEAFKELLGEQ